MVTGVASLSAGDAAVTGDPMSGAELFWANVREGDGVGASAAGRGIRLPPVSNTFSFDEDDVAGGVTGGAASGAAVPSEGMLLSVDVETPKAVVDSWNSEAEVELVVIEDSMCLASWEGKRGGGPDFRVCSLPARGAGGGLGECVKSVHSSDDGKVVHRLELTDYLAVYGIGVPTSGPKVIQQGVFSQPLFHVQEWPQESPLTDRHELLLSLKFTPRTWKCLIENYPGKESIYLSHVGTKPQADPSSPERKSSSEVLEAPGLSSILKNPPPSRQSLRDSSGYDTMAPRKFGWETSGDEEEDPLLSSSRLSPNRSSPSRSPSQDSVRLAKYESLVKDLTKEIKTLKADAKAKDDSLTRTLREMQRDIRNAREAVDQPSSASLRLTEWEKDEIADLLKERIGNNLFATKEEVDAKVSRSDLTRMNLVDQKMLEGSFDSLPSLPTDWRDRLIKLEEEVLDPNGQVRTLLGRMRILEDRNVNDSVTLGGYTFRDVNVVKLWMQVLGIPEAYQYCVDAKAQLVLAVEDFDSLESGLASEASATKAGYSCVQSANMALCHRQTFPEIFIRRSKSKEDAQSGGYVFQAACGTYDLFKGNTEVSFKNTLLKTLEDNRRKFQATLDDEFPPDQTAHTKTNAVFSDVLRRGYFQAVGLVESIVPFYDMMTEAGMGSTDAWSKVLTYVKAVFLRIQRVRAISTKAESGPMIFGMMKATVLLDSYGEVEWIRHPDVNSAMVVSSMQREGKKNSEIIKTFSAEIAAIKANKARSEKTEKDLNNLKNKNPTWNK